MWIYILLRHQTAGNLVIVQIYNYGGGGNDGGGGYVNKNK